MLRLGVRVPWWPWKFDISAFYLTLMWLVWITSFTSKNALELFFSPPAVRVWYLVALEGVLLRQTLHLPRFLLPAVSNNTGHLTAEYKCHLHCDTWSRATTGEKSLSQRSYRSAATVDRLPPNCLMLADLWRSRAATMRPCIVFCGSVPCTVSGKKEKKLGRTCTVLFAYL